MTPAILVRVQSIRSQNPYGRGGCIFVGIEISETGDVVDAKSYLVIKATGLQLGDGLVQPGQWWRVSGESELYERTVNGYLVRERQIKADQVSLMRMSGEHIVTFMAESEDFQGVGMVKARKLWAVFGEGLYGHLDNGDVDALSRVLTAESAKQVVAAWGLQGNARTLQWMQGSGIDVDVGRKLVAYFGAEAQERLEEDPYRLLSFCATWKQVDKLARDHFAVEDADPRRLQGAIEEALYRVFDDGHTRAPISSLVSRLASVLGGPCREGAHEALANGLSNGSFVIGANGDVHPTGAWVMEATVARAMVARLIGTNNLPLLHPAHIDTIVAAYEAGEGITLNVEQRLAIHTSAANALSLIVGGAGVGKTTVLKALYQVYDATRTRIFQVALAGRAAKRMMEATGRPASTIASFLKTAKEADLAGRCVLVTVSARDLVDEVIDRLNIEAAPFSLVRNMKRQVVRACLEITNRAGPVPVVTAHLKALYESSSEYDSLPRVTDIFSAWFEDFQQLQLSEARPYSREYIYCLMSMITQNANPTKQLPSVPAGPQPEDS